MAIDNLISIEFSDEELKTIDSAIAALNGVLAGKAVNLTPDERRQHGCIADRNKVLVDKVKSYMEAAPQTVPRTIDVDEFNRDYKARACMDTPLRELTIIVEKLRDTKTLLDSDNYSTHARVLSLREIPGVAE